MRRQANKQDDTYSTEAKDPLELIARFIVGGSYRAPVEGQGSRPASHTNEIAGAVGLMQSKLEQRVVVAVATRAGADEVAKVSLAVFQRVVRSILDIRPECLDLRDGADRWRLRLVIYDATHELVWPERRLRRPFGELAKAAKMRKGDYIRVHKCATSVLQAALADGRREFARRLWGEQ